MTEPVQTHALSSAKPRVTRQLAAVACKNKKCGALLVLTSEEPTLTCALCGKDARAPKSVIEDLDFLRKLDIELPEKIEDALASVIDRRFSRPDLPKWVFLLLAVAGGTIGATSERVTKDMAIWGAVGAVLAVFIVGWCAQFLATMAENRALLRVREGLEKRRPRCPKCDKTIVLADACGTFDCKCGARLGSDPALAVEMKTTQPLAEVVSEAAEAALKDQRWLEEGGMPRGELAWLIVIALFVLGAMYAKWHQVV